MPYGVGIFDGDSAFIIVNGIKKHCPYSCRWRNMLRRCYDVNDTQNASYLYTTVCDEWLTFSNFKSWMETQDWEENELDKDLLGDGSVYDSKSCVFIPKWLNDGLGNRSGGINSLGCTLNKKRNYYRAKIKCFGTFICLGEHPTMYEAHRAWQKAKIEWFEECISRLSSHYRRDEVVTALKDKITILEYEIENNLTTNKL